MHINDIASLLVCLYSLVVWFLVNITLSALGARPICHIRQLTVNCDCFKSGAVAMFVQHVRDLIHQTSSIARMLSNLKLFAT